jgi:2-oxopent-4-enoate/cis-2-oxohex-4-enoate hydratase
MKQNRIDELGDELYAALRNRRPVSPLTTREPDISLTDAYQISSRLLRRRCDDGEFVIGKKIGVTSKAVQQMLKVYSPDFGYLTNRMMYQSGDVLPISDTLIAPRAEGELAFVLKQDLQGPGVNVLDVLRAVDYLMPCFEIVDSRIADWKIRIEDTVADNASCGLFVLGDAIADISGLDLVTCGMVLSLNGEIISTGAGAAAMGSPLTCVAWLANKLGEFGVPLKAGEIILSGSLVPLQPVKAGDSMSLMVGGVGSASVRFA